MKKPVFSSTKVAVIGAGAVGSTTAYTIMQKNIASQVVLIDINEKKEKGEVMDIGDGMCFSETGCVRGANFKDAADADIIVLTAGAAQKPGETRLDLVNKNKSIVASIFKQIGRIKSSAIIIVVTNPVDIITHLIQQISRLPQKQVFGTGTGLDTARLHSALAHYFKVNGQSISGFVMGEHGDSEFVAWSTVSIGGVPAKELLSTKEMKEIENKVKNEVYEIISRKGATFYGIAMVVSDIVEAIFFDQHKVLPMSARLDDWNGVNGVCLGAPTVIAREGVIKHWPAKLDRAEKKKFQSSAKTIKKYL